MVRRLLSVIALSLGLCVTVAAARPPTEGPLLRVLTPADGVQLNSTSLRVEAIVMLRDAVDGGMAMSIDPDVDTVSFAIGM